MAIIKKKQLKEMGSEELTKKMAELEAEVVRERGAKETSGRPANAGRLNTARKTVARIKTLLSQRGQKV